MKHSGSITDVEFNELNSDIECGNDVLSGYRMPEIRLSVLEFFLWPFSSVGRLKRRFATAVQRQPEKRKKQALHQAVNRVNFKGIRPDKQGQVRELIRLSLSFLCFRNLRDGDVNDAILALDQLGEHDHQATDLRIFRVGVLDAILGTNGFENKTKSILSALIADSKASSYFEHPVLLRTFDCIYCIDGKDKLAKVFKAGCADFKRITIPARIIDLCECPALFKDEHEAAQWGKRIHPEQFPFSKSMCRDANLIQVRISEWRGDADALIAFATSAFRCDEGSAEASYWLIRSHLHRSSEMPTLVGNIDSIPDDVRWKRLLIGVDLHRKKDFISVRAIIPVLKHQLGKIDEQERRLFLELAHIALKPSVNKSRADHAITSEISLEIRALAPSLGWATINVALDLLIVKSDYGAAFSEITKSECACEELSSSLYQIIGALSDNWQLSDKALPCIDVMRKAMLSLLGQEHKCSETTFENLLSALNARLNDPLVTLVPGLGRSVKGLITIFEFITGAKEHDYVLTELKRDTIAPRWLRWLAFRIFLLQAGSDDKAREHVSVSDFRVGAPNGTTFIVWLASYALPQPVHWVVSISNKIKQDHGESSFAKLLFDYAVDRSFRSCSWNEDSFKKIKPFHDTGKEISAVIDQDIYFINEALIGKASLAQAPRLAKERFQCLLNEICGSAWVTRVWWEPIFSYWLAVAQAELGEDRLASEGFRALLAGPKSGEARAQLAMLAMKSFNLADATKWLDGISPRFPSIFYAQALLSWRSGNTDAAIGFLSSFDETFGIIGTAPHDVWEHYRLTCRRLLASIYERTNRTKEATNVLQLIRNTAPSDPIAAVRLTRLVFHDAYRKYREESILSARACYKELPIEKFLTPVKNRGEAEKFILFWKLLSTEGDQLVDVAGSLPEAFSWQQLFLRRLLEEGQGENATYLLKTAFSRSDSNAPPVYFAKSKSILLSWHFLRQAWRFLPSERDDGELVNGLKITDFRSLFPELNGQFSSDQITPQVLSHCFQTLAKNGLKDDEIVDSSVSHIRAAATIAGKISPNEPMNDSILDSEDRYLHPLLAVHALTQMPEKFAGRFSKENTLELFQSPDVVLTGSQRRLGLALTRWYANDKDVLNDLSTLEQAKDSIPLGGEYLWLAKAFIMFKNATYKPLFESEMPPKVADLSNHDACLLLSMAYARLALQLWRNGNSRGSLQHIKQAASTLAAITDEPGDQKQNK